MAGILQTRSKTRLSAGGLLWYKMEPHSLPTSNTGLQSNSLVDQSSTFWLPDLHRFTGLHASIWGKLLSSNSIESQLQKSNTLLDLLAHVRHDEVFISSGCGDSLHYCHSQPSDTTGGRLPSLVLSGDSAGRGHFHSHKLSQHSSGKLRLPLQRLQKYRSCIWVSLQEAGARAHV